MDKYGVDLNPQIPRDLELEAVLLKEVETRQTELLLEAMLQIGRCHNVQIPIGNSDLVRLHACRVNYSAKEKKFTFIQYSMKSKRGKSYYAKRFALK